MTTAARRLNLGRVTLHSASNHFGGTKTRKVQLLLVIVSLTLLSCVGAFAQVTPSADAYTNTADATTNYGGGALLYVNGATEAAYIQFNLASIPSGASISQATLKLYVNGVTTAGSFNVDYANGSWSESKIDANNAPPPGANIVSSVNVTAADKNQYILINVTPALEAWLDGSETNNGIVLVANASFNATFDSKENATTSHPAELDIAYATGKGGGTITGVTTASGSGLTGGGTSGTLNLSLTNACSSKQVLQWNGSAWACSAAGTGTITGVTAGTDLVGGGTAGNVTLNLNTTALNSAYARLAAANTFTASQTVNGNINASSLTINTTDNLAIIANTTIDAAILGGSDSDSGVAGTSVSGDGVFGDSSTGNGVEGDSSGANGYGVYGTNLATDSIAIYGFDQTSSSAGLVGEAPYALIANGSALAGEFIGNVEVEGSVSKDSGSFKIDHPLDPANKYLSHSFVESPDMMNIYNGNVTTDGEGNAVVTLPDWFEALNTDFRYQVTVLGQFAQAIVSSKVANHQFSIKTDKPNVEVSWQITGIRHDAWANAHRIPVEEAKTPQERGFYRHPELYGAPPQKSISWARHPNVMKQMNTPHVAKPPRATALAKNSPAPVKP